MVKNCLLFLYQQVRWSRMEILWVWAPCEEKIDFISSAASYWSRWIEPVVDWLTPSRDNLFFVPFCCIESHTITYLFISAGNIIIRWHYQSNTHIHTQVCRSDRHAKIHAWRANGYGSNWINFGVILYLSSLSLSLFRFIRCPLHLPKSVMLQNKNCVRMASSPMICVLHVRSMESSWKFHIIVMP